MSDARGGRLRRLGEALSDGRAIDWDAECRSTPRLRSRLRRLQQLQALERAHRSIAAATPAGPDAKTATRTDPGVPNPSADGLPAGLSRWGALRILEPIGHGSFGDVYRAFDPRLRREVALKLRRLADPDSESTARRFLDEARSLARVRHPNVVIVHGADVRDGRAGFWMEFIRGRTLASRLADEGPLGAEEAASVGLAVCRALAAVHAAGLVHGDVKATNVMREEGGRIVLMDFGAASSRSRDPSSLATAEAFGTPMVLAPEVLRGEPARPSSDLYSVGVLLHRLVSGRYPVEARTWAELREKHERGERTPLRDLRPDLSPAFVQVVERAIEPDPGARFRTAGEMERSLLAGVREGSPDEGQTLRSLLDELGRVPEEMCRHIAREAAKALARSHASGDVHGALDLERMLLLPDGGVALLRPPGATKSTPRGATPQADLRDLGAALVELATGHRPARAGGLPAGPFEAPGEKHSASGGIPGRLSPFFEEVLSRLFGGPPDPSFATARDVVQLLVEEERGAWWKERERAIRRSSRNRRRSEIPIPHETPLHGRDREIAALRAAYDRARAGDGRVVLIDGEAGIGKTRLVDELVRTLEREGEDLNLLYGCYPPGGAATATGAFIAAYRDHLVGDGLEAALEDYLGVAPLLIRPFAALLRGEGAGAEGGPFTKDSLQTAFVHVTTALAAERPTIVLIDDLHFAPEEGRALFASLALAVPGHRILLLGVARPELPEAWMAGLQRHHACSHLVLSRLADADVLHILRDALRSSRLAEELAPVMTTRCDGNPFFLFENLRALEDGRIVTRRPDGEWEVTAPIRNLPAPPSVRRLILARLAGLEEEDRTLLDVAACSGFELDPALVADAVGLGALPALKRFALIEKKLGLVRASGRRYVFDHHLVQEALYEDLFDPLREHYHAALARALEAREQGTARDPKDLDGAVAVALCDHYLRGGRGADGLRYLSAALDHLETSHLNGPAAEMADRALRLPGLLAGLDRARVLLRRASRLGLMGKQKGVTDALEEALALAAAVGDRALSAHIKSKLGLHLRQTGRYDEAAAILLEAIREAESAEDPGTAVRARNNLGAVHFETGRFAEARAQYEQAIALAREAADPAAEEMALSNLGVLLNALGQYEEAERHLRERPARAREIRDPAAEANANGNLGHALMNLGRFEEARACFERLLMLSREIGYRPGEHHAFANLGAVLQELGRYDEALACLEAQLRLSHETGLRKGEAVGLANRSQLFAAMGDFDRARAGLEAARTLCDEGGFRWFESSLLECWGAIELDAGDAPAAERRYREALAQYRAADNRSGIADVQVSLGAIAAALDRPEEARSHLLEAMAIATELRSGRELVRAAVELASLPGGDVAAAREAFASRGSSLSHRERMKVSYRLWRVTRDRAHLDTAHRLLVELRDHAPAPYRDTVLENVPLHREIRRAWAGPPAHPEPL
jgi:serine/threonine protein kinase/tetratricopeptide (TPR) repeat protein